MTIKDGFKFGIGLFLAKEVVDVILKPLYIGVAKATSDIVNEKQEEKSPEDIWEESLK